MGYGYRLRRGPFDPAPENAAQGGGLPSKWAVLGDAQVVAEEGMTFATAADFAFTVTSGGDVVVDAATSIELTADAGSVSLQAAEDVSLAGVGIFIASDGDVVQIYGEPVHFTGPGVFIIDDLPTVDPSNAGQLWNDAGILKVSAG